MDTQTFASHHVLNKWKGVLDIATEDKIADRHRRSVTAQILENTEAFCAGGGAASLNEDTVPVNAMGGSSSTAGAGGIDTFDPIMISLVRRAMPNLLAYDMCGVQPMKGPTGLVFAMRSHYANQTGPEAFFNEANTAYSNPYLTGANTLGQQHLGTLVGAANNAANGTYNYGSSMSTSQAEALGATGGDPFPEMAFSIEKVTVTAGSRALKARYTMEMAQDLRAIHGLDAENELVNILQTEVMAEINREVVRTIAISAVPGSQTDVTTAGYFDLDTDANGRWMGEKFKGLMYQFDREANQIAKATRRGRGNFILCTSDVAAAMNATGRLTNTPNLDNNLLVDDTGPTFVGILNNQYKVFIDPYAIGGNFFVMGFKGKDPRDAGIFYCPYVPLQMVRAVDPQSFASAIGFKTRYGMVAHPYAGGINVGHGIISADSNVFYRRTIVNHLL